MLQVFKIVGDHIPIVQLPSGTVTNNEGYDEQAVGEEQSILVNEEPLQLRRSKRVI